MRKILYQAILLTCMLLCLDTTGQELLIKMKPLGATQINAIESGQSTRIKQEVLMRQPGQHNIIILSGNNNLQNQYTAQWVAQKTGVPIYLIRLSTVISTNIFITKQNLHIIFETAKNKGWILFFDEGDALFGNRGTVKDSHHRFDTESTNFFFDQVDRYRGSIIISVSASNNINPLIFEKYVRFRIH